MEKFSHHCFEFGPFVLDVAQCLLLKNGDQILLTPKTFDTLRILVENGGRVVHKDEMMNLLWPDSFVEEANLAQYIALLRKSLGEADSATKYIETIPKRGYRFIAEVRKCDGVAFGPDSDSGEAFANLEPVGGAVPLDSRFYVERPTDMEFHAAIARHDSIVLVKGARQVGKSSLLSRGLQRARQAGNNVIITDFQALSASHLQSPDKLFLTLAELTADQLELDSDPAKLWNPERAASVNLQLYLRREVLSKTSAFLVWGLDEVDCLFRYDYASEVFALFRSWHNARALDPAGPWQRLTLAMAYATEAHMFITDLNQSPFNVGTRLMLDDFTLEQVADLNRQYGSPLKDSDLRYYYDLVG